MTSLPAFDSRHHPISIVKFLQKKYGNSLILTFSRYSYVPRSKNDYRRSFQLSISKLTDARLSYWLGLLKRNREIALHSNVEMNSRTFHIPMIDFLGRPKDNEIHALCKFAYVPSKIVRTLYLFDSGRSFHGYSTTLLSVDEWRDFMAGLLLANLPEAAPIVDWRWIGHRLRSDFASLRWSCNSKNYVKVPVFLGKYGCKREENIDGSA